MLRNEFYSAFAPGDDRGTVKYKDQRFQGLHPAAFTYDEWQKIRSMTQSLYRASTRTEQVKHIYQFAGYISCIHCGLKSRCDTGNTPDNRRQYYRDTAKARRILCTFGGNLMIRIDMVDTHFGELLKRLALPENWREIIFSYGAARGRSREALGLIFHSSYALRFKCGILLQAP